MQPNESQAPLQSAPPTYLDQIAAQPTQPTMKPWLLWTLIGGVILAVAVVGMLILNSGGPSQSERLTRFVYRVNALRQLSVDNAKNIQDSKLLATNAQLGSVLAGISQQSTDPLARNGIKELPKEPKNSLITAEYAKLRTKLDDARLNVVFDRTYSREVAYQLRTLRAEATVLYKNSRNESVKSYLETSDTNLKSLETQFADFNEAS